MGAVIKLTGRLVHAIKPGGRIVIVDEAEAKAFDFRITGEASGKDVEKLRAKAEKAEKAEKAKARARAERKVSAKGEQGNKSEIEALKAQVAELIAKAEKAEVEKLGNKPASR
jgi:hypothetical protein